MNIFLNAVSRNWIIILFGKDRQIIDKEYISIIWMESSKLTDIIDNFLKKNTIKYTEIENIFVINWPWSFTWIRTITLIVNTLSFLFLNIKLTPISFFDLFDNYPIIKQSSKRDLFVKKDEKCIIELIQNEDFLKYVEQNKIDSIYWDWLAWESQIDYWKILLKLKETNQKQIEAFYVKKPNIS